jgi:hypothetical protein
LCLIQQFYLLLQFVNVTVTASPLTSFESSFGVTVAPVSVIASIVTSLSVKLDEFALLIAARIVAGFYRQLYQVLIFNNIF